MLKSFCASFSCNSLPHSGCLALQGVNPNLKKNLKRITLLQKRAIRILHSAAYRDHTSPLVHRYKVLKFVDLVLLENCIFVNKCFNDKAFSLISNHFKLTGSSPPHCTRSVSNGLIFKKLYTTPFTMVTNLLSTQQ